MQKEKGLSTVQYSTVQYSTAQHSTARLNSAFLHTVNYRTAVEKTWNRIMEDYPVSGLFCACVNPE